MSEARSHGKVILLGEHAVVYGVPAIAGGISLGARARALTCAGPSSVQAGPSRATIGDGSDLGRALHDLISALEVRGAWAIEVELELPAGAGLGASAALAVAVARAVLSGAEQAPDEARVARAALAWERVFHGNPSGVDTAAAALGGCISFVRGQAPIAVPLARPLELGVVLAGPPASTKLMVDGIARLKERRPEIVAKAFDGIRSLVGNALGCLAAGDVVGLGRLLDLNQMLLAGLLVSTEEIERACRLARDAGALGAKLTGAGGGGAVIALLPDQDPERVLQAWRGAGLTCFRAQIRERRGAA